MTVDELLAANHFDDCVEISVLQILTVLVAAHQRPTSGAPTEGEP